MNKVINQGLACTAHLGKYVRSSRALAELVMEVGQGPISPHSLHPGTCWRAVREQGARSFGPARVAEAVETAPRHPAPEPDAPLSVLHTAVKT